MICNTFFWQCAFFKNSITQNSLTCLILTLLSCLCIAPAAARVCDNELLRCQNGGVCVNNVRCSCPSAYTGVLCEKPRCESELGGCMEPDSGQAPLAPPSSLRLLLLLLGSALLREASSWPAML